MPVGSGADELPILAALQRCSPRLRSKFRRRGGAAGTTGCDDFADDPTCGDSDDDEDFIDTLWAATLECAVALGIPCKAPSAASESGTSVETFDMLPTPRLHWPRDLPAEALPQRLGRPIATANNTPHGARLTPRPLPSSRSDGGYLVGQGSDGFVGGELCSRCLRPVPSLDRVVVHGEPCHRECFRCVVCSVRLGSVFWGGDGATGVNTVYCKQHQPPLEPAPALPPPLPVPSVHAPVHSVEGEGALAPRSVMGAPAPRSQVGAPAPTSHMGVPPPASTAVQSGGVKGSARLPAQPVPQGPRLTATAIAFSHPGGCKPVDAKNQDTYFTAEFDAHNWLFGVLDGHGSENGTLAAEVASAVIKEYCVEHFSDLRTDATAVFNAAFERAHEAVRVALLEADPELVDEQGVPCEQWEEPNRGVRQEAADGGTTATVIALIDGAKLIHAQVGDSSAMLGGVLRPGRKPPWPLTSSPADAGGHSSSSGSGDGGAPSLDREVLGDMAFEELMAEHSATNGAEYERMLASGARGPLVRFVYETPSIDFDEVEHLPSIWRLAEAPASQSTSVGLSVGLSTVQLRPVGQPRSAHTPKPKRKYVLDDKTRDLALADGTMPKNSRGELPAILLTPKLDATFPKMELPQSLAMTRSIGDLYMQTYGVTWRPEVSSIDLASRAESLDGLTLILASDGIWDLWTNREVFPLILRPPEGAATSPAAVVQSFYELSLERGTEFFGSSADNMTGIVVYLSPAATSARTARRPGDLGRPGGLIELPCQPALTPPPTTLVPTSADANASAPASHPPLPEIPKPAATPMAAPAPAPAPMIEEDDVMC